jgi:FkbM family methyltransferase
MPLRHPAQPLESSHLGAAASDWQAPRLWPLATAYVRAELPAWGRVYGWIGGTDEARWQRAPLAEVKGKLHGYRMRLDLSNWSERLTWSLARYHDLPIQLVLQRILRPGDGFVDIGANLGMVTLQARALVGTTGRVIACEPNPRLQQRLRATLADNGLDNVDLVATAVGDTRGTAQLREYANHSGWGSLSAVGPEGFAATSTWSVPVAVGDELLASVPPAQPMVIKIDVEGFEVPVLRGLRQTLTTRWPAVLLEVADAHQRRAGYSEAELRAPLEDLGYTGYAITSRRRGLRGQRLQLRAIAAEHGSEVDALFVPPQGPLHDRIAPLVG